jgi:hypothetical protein
VPKTMGYFMPDAMSGFVPDAREASRQT